MPRQIVIQPGSPSHLRLRCPPSRATRQDELLDGQRPLLPVPPAAQDRHQQRVEIAPSPGGPPSPAAAPPPVAFTKRHRQHAQQRDQRFDPCLASATASSSIPIPVFWPFVKLLHPRPPLVAGHPLPAPPPRRLSPRPSAGSTPAALSLPAELPPPRRAEPIPSAAHVRACPLRTCGALIVTSDQQHSTFAVRAGWPLVGADLHLPAQLGVQSTQQVV